MFLSKISLRNFRNYNKLDINLDKNLNIFIGKNGQGKTNILESIYILALTKSYRLGVETNLIKIGEESTKIKGTLKYNKIIKDLEFFLSKDNKTVKINKTNIKKISEYINNLNVIIFSPDDLEIIKGSPNIRRNYLNIEISQIFNNYIDLNNKYNKILKIRNEYLKMLNLNTIADKRYLDILTDKLILLAIEIYKYRIKYINEINNNISSIYFNITNINNLKIKYNSNINLENINDDKKIYDEMKNKYNQNYKKELFQGMTLYGPHRDDFSFYIDDNDLKFFGSQGQQKLAIIALKLSEINIFKNETNTNPILLLDDIFSEIDLEKKNKLLKYLNEDIQIIITTTDLKNINKKLVNNAKIFEINSGSIVERVK